MVTRKQNSAAATASSSLKRTRDATGVSDDESDSEDGYEEPKALKASNSKRQKTTKPSTSSDSKTKSKATAKPTRRRKDLSLLPTVPLDVLYEILGQLGPKDLLSLSKTNKLWRGTVLNPETVFLWRDARGAYDAPEPPEDFTEERWAALLFENACQRCGKKATMSVDWLLLRRVCKSCKRRHLMYERKFKATFPGENKDILDYVYHTFTGVATSSRGDRPGDSKFYWDEDVKRALEQMESLSTAGLKQWKLDMVEAVKKRRAMVKAYEEWESHKYELAENDAEGNREKRLKAVTQKFVEAGYELVDIQNTFSTNSSGICSGTPHVTNAVWSKIRPHMEKSLTETRNRRLEKELRPAVEARMKILEELYDAYLDRECRPSERYYCPPVSAFRPKPDFMEIIEADKDTIITAKSFETITSNLGKYLIGYQQEKKEYLKTLVPKDRQGTNLEPPCDLARHVFSRAHLNPSRYHWGSSQTMTIDQIENQVLVGWSTIGTHWYPESDQFEVRPGVNLSMPARFLYNERVSRISSQMVSLVGLDPTTATVQEMDAKDPRFVHTEYDTAIGYQVLTWRAALGLVHSLVMSSYSVECPLRLAMDDEEAEAKENEEELRASAKAWSCNHCPQFLLPDEAETRGVILEHLKEAHGIVDPQPGEDFFVNERRRHAFEKPYEIVVPNVQKYRCTCSTCGRLKSRRFAKTNLDTHLKTVFPYSWNQPVEGRHYHPVPSGQRP